MDAARDLIDARRILVSGALAENASRQVGADEPVHVTAARPRFVGRGGEKLEGAIERFGVRVADRRVLDAGASTGGFSDCVLQRGAREVVAVDVGYGQLHERVASDDRVTVVDRTNIRHLAVADVGGPADLVVADLSFISLRTVAPALLGSAAPGADLVVLVKPQFEAARSEVDRGRGVIVDREVWARVLTEVIAAFTEGGATMMGVMASPITGNDGNVEFLLHVVVPDAAGATDALATDEDHRASIDAAIREATMR